MRRSSAKRLPLLDAAFLGLETREQPMHVASLQIYSLPPAAPADFLATLVQRLRNPQTLSPPWNLKLAPGPLARLAPAMMASHDVDFDYHVRHSALPAPGGERELGELISHLHSVVLDRSRPLWTCHVIEGLEGGRFAIYLKVHHALVDGVRGIQLIADSLSPDPEQPLMPLWEGRRRRPEPSSAPAVATAPSRDTQRVSRWHRLRVLSQALQPMIQREAGTSSVRRPFDAPPCILNGQITNARRVATQQIALERVKQLAKTAQVSINDVFLAVCSAALRRHLLSQQALPRETLVTAVPVSLRKSGDLTSNNAVGFIWSSLATDLSDPRERLAAIHQSIGASKRHLDRVPEEARPAFTMLTGAPAALVGSLGTLATRFRPPMNVTISNVPGPRDALYLGGAKLEALYPISIPTQGQVLNITCISYAGHLNIGFTGSRDSLPHLQKLAVYSLDAIDELEQAFGLGVKPRRAPPRRAARAK